MKKILGLLLLVFSIMFITTGCFFNNGPKTDGPAGVFVSDNWGKTWKKSSLMPTIKGVNELNNVSVYKIKADPQDPQTLYWLSRGQGLFYSLDGGTSWQRDKVVKSGFIYDVAIHPQKRCIVYATNGRQVFKTENCFRTWQEVYREVDMSISVRRLSIDPFDPHFVYLGKSDGTLLRSEDSGTSWTTINDFNSKILAIEFDKNRQGAIYVATLKRGLFRSYDNGENWQSLKKKLSEYSKGLTYRGFYINPQQANLIYWICRYGILVSANGGDDWEVMKLVTPPGSVNIYSFSVDPKDKNIIYYTATDEIRSTFYYSVDGGKNWITRKLPTGQIPTALYIYPEVLDNSAQNKQNKQNISKRIYLGFTIPESE